MRKALLLLCFFFSVNQFCFSQSWAPVGATWYYSIGVIYFPYIKYVQFQSVGDTLINGKDCSIIKYIDGEFGYWFLPGSSQTVYSYSDSGKVYVFDPNNNAFSLTYDFNLDSGQTYTSTWDTCTYNYTLYSKDSINLNSHWLRRYRLWETGTWIYYIEGIGSTFHLFNCNQTCSNIIYCGDFVSGLRCYSDSVIGFVDFDSTHACDYEVTGINELNPNNIFTLSPNPAHDFITIQNNQQKDLSITIFSSTGEVVTRTTLAKDAATSVNLSGLSAGIYVVNARSDKNFAFRKFVKQ